MPRNGTGTYLLPSGINPVTDGTVIDANWANQTLADLGAATTGSLPRDGQAPMLGPLKLADGTVGSPGIGWNSDASTGLFRPGTATLGFTAGGIEQARFTAGNLLLGSTSDTGEKLQVTGATKLAGAVNVSSTLNVTGNVTAPSFTGNLAGVASNATFVNVNDTRATQIGPALGSANVRFDFKANTTDGLSDGGLYHGVMTFQPYIDASGGGTRQLGFTDSDNLWIRGSGNNLSAFGAWKRILDSTSISGYAPSLTGAGASGTWAINVTGNAATATKASTLARDGGSGAPMMFSWSGQSGQPSWVWGGNDGATMYIYNPSNFNVASAATASTVTSAANRTDNANYPVVWNTTGGTSSNYSCAAVYINSSTGTLGATNLYASNDVTIRSDARVKTNVTVIEEALEKVKQLRGVTYTRTDGDATRHAGVIAQEVQAVLPEVVREGDDGLLSVAYGNMVSILIEAVKELSAKVEALERAK